jgi:hypothetical protein
LVSERQCKEIILKDTASDKKSNDFDVRDLIANETKMEIVNNFCQEQSNFSKFSSFLPI